MLVACWCVHTFASENGDLGAQGRKTHGLPFSKRDREACGHGCYAGAFCWGCRECCRIGRLSGICRCVKKTGCALSTGARRRYRVGTSTSKPRSGWPPHKQQQQHQQHGSSQNNNRGARGRRDRERAEVRQKPHLGPARGSNRLRVRLQRDRGNNNLLNITIHADMDSDFPRYRGQVAFFPRRVTNQTAPAGRRAAPSIYS